MPKKTKNQHQLLLALAANKANTRKDMRPEVAIIHNMLDTFPLFKTTEERVLLFNNQVKAIVDCVIDQTVPIEDIHDLTFRLCHQSDIDGIHPTVNHQINHIMAYANALYRKDDKIFASTWKNGLEHYPEDDNWKSAFAKAYQRTYRLTA